eukprot:TRINITY_DN857_c0_g1_i2.p1 TRINITY_DN857_c0_g1~~TRINITY_DN857_c0_g1_i2.p1  ORF type:complete len:365 (+),score=46.50 TRINITY_DN857_c0_g1_i2:104-1198(+)
MAALPLLLLLLSAVYSQLVSCRELSSSAVKDVKDANGLKVTAGSGVEFFEKNYTDGILNLRVPTTFVKELSQWRRSKFQPQKVRGYFLGEQSFLNIFWAPSTSTNPWYIVWDDDATKFQSDLNFFYEGGNRLLQVDSYTKEGNSTIFYAAIFILNTEWPWPFGPSFDYKYGLPFDSTYCCASGSRVMNMKNKGMRPTSIAVAHELLTGTYSVADMWDSNSPSTWSVGVRLTAADLLGQSTTLASSGQGIIALNPYREATNYTGTPSGELETLFNFIAYKVNSASIYRVVTNEGRSGLDLAFNYVPKIPFEVVTYPFGSGAAVSGNSWNSEAYSIVWDVDGLSPPSAAFEEASQKLQSHSHGVQK